MKKGYVYFMSNKNNTVIYIGVTSNISNRVYQHKNKVYKGFTARYNCDKLIYMEEHSNIIDAIKREKQLKAGNRNKKELLVQSQNPTWDDLAKDWLFD